MPPGARSIGTSGPASTKIPEMLVRLQLTGVRRRGGCAPRLAWHGRALFSGGVHRAPASFSPRCLPPPLRRFAAAPVPKEQLLVPPADAVHYVVVSEAGKHGDMWRWTLPDGRIAYRHSQSLRGWITETDQTMTLRRRRPADDGRRARDHAERRRRRNVRARRHARPCGRAPPTAACVDGRIGYLLAGRRRSAVEPRAGRQAGRRRRRGRSTCCPAAMRR